jgi:hypothetical protein
MLTKTIYEFHAVNSEQSAEIIINDIIDIIETADSIVFPNQYQRVVNCNKPGLHPPKTYLVVSRKHHIVAKRFLAVALLLKAESDRHFSMKIH